MYCAVAGLVWFLFVLVASGLRARDLAMHVLPVCDIRALSPLLVHDHVSMCLAQHCTYLITVLLMAVSDLDVLRTFYAKTSVCIDILSSCVGSLRVLTVCIMFM